MKDYNNKFFIVSIVYLLLIIYILLVKLIFYYNFFQYFPKFTLREVKCFVTHYMISAKPENVIEASYFFLGCVMNAFMRIIVYLKTAVLNKYAWDYLGNAIENFLDTLNVCILSIIII